LILCFFSAAESFDPSIRLVYRSKSVNKKSYSNSN
jgi:hypothetical protein